MRHLVIAALVVLSGSTVALAQGDPPHLAPASMSCLSPDPSATKQSLDELRRAGPVGLRAILAEYDKDPSTISAADVDAVAGQHDALWSRLYWYTDLDAAKAAAKAERKPILYLRMLGKLTDEYSCANSRFFRTVLYANARVSKLLRDRFVLVWASERPVPVITVDYGDGRVLKRTITGNSIHYVLDADGNIIDALPGLYDPVKFAEILWGASEIAVSDSVESRREYWRRSSAALAGEWQRGSAGAMIDVAPIPSPRAPISTKQAERPEAAEAMPRAISKGRVEIPLVRAAFPPPAPDAAKAAHRARGKSFVEAPVLEHLSRAFAEDLSESSANADAATWERVKAFHLADARLDANSLALVRSQNPAAYADREVFNRTVDQFQSAIADDTVRNNFRFRPQILAWLLRSTAQGSAAPIDLEKLNQRVYAELFLTPRSDPWLGLVPQFTYSALASDGCSTR